ncbi:HpcH/HpaI aldolase/citrate lyase family protein [Sinorhizobium sp. BG8]|uniref:aldolase/citrate lyase family protein n=1 Tax=Sinorhizobium sp. BG8 TaxID=2613773 RepID=UPI00193DD3E5|nr:HpcH/HpaI aldolase/citrate lyase family protein [Sinorhizobium sp. BG8]QRM53651.1 HpcH/HpaI aldolase/citrate lyase family protein [Sinorhizobium sp. BG8]
MPAPINPFKAALKEGRFQLGLWLALGSPYAAEIACGSGYDWLLIDGEHGPSDMPLMSAQIGAVAKSGSHPIVRPPMGDAWLIKQLLDQGAQTFLIPMVETVEQARALVRAVRYPPHGIRGVGAGLGRASNFGRVSDYLASANDEVCLLLQIESRAALDNLDEIAALEGVDGLFIGPSDLAADMGFLGKPGSAPVRDAIEAAFERIHSHGKARGIMTVDMDEAREYRALGADFMAIGTDVTSLVRALDGLRREFLGEAPAGGKTAGY